MYEMMQCGLKLLGYMLSGTPSTGIRSSLRLSYGKKGGLGLTEGGKGIGRNHSLAF